MFPTMPENFTGSLRISAQRNINLLVLRLDVLKRGGTQLTSLPVKGEFCRDSPFTRCFYPPPNYEQ